MKTDATGLGSELSLFFPIARCTRALFLRSDPKREAGKGAGWAAPVPPDVTNRDLRCVTRKIRAQGPGRANKYRNTVRVDEEYVRLSMEILHRVVCEFEAVGG
jgi:hypothetical protein